MVQKEGIYNLVKGDDTWQKVRSCQANVLPQQPVYLALPKHKIAVKYVLRPQILLLGAPPANKLLIVLNPAETAGGHR